MGEGAGNGDGLTRLLGGGLFGGGGCGRRCGGEFGLEFTDDALQFGELFGVFFGLLVEKFAKAGLTYKEIDEQNRRGEQRQPIEHVQ
jgi:hypothetical protein